MRSGLRGHPRGEKHQSDSLILGISELLSNSNAGFSRPESILLPILFPSKERVLDAEHERTL